MRVLVIGCGKQGSVIANTLLNWKINTAVCDNSKENLKKFKGRNKILIDVNDRKRFKNLLKNYDLLINALPSRYGKYILECAIESKRNLVDISFMQEDVYEFEEDIKHSGIFVIPDAGLAPGLSNLCAGNACAKISPHTIKIYVGGIPKEENPPLNLCVTFNPEDLLSEYKRYVKIKENGILKTVPPLTGIEEIEFPMGKFECFYTDGLRTLLHTLDIENMCEKTIRYKGHAEFIKNTPEDELLKIFNEYVNKEIEDMVLFRVIAKSEKECIEYNMIDYYDRKEKLSAMSRTTGFTSAVITKKIIEGKIKGKGIIPLEKIGEKEELFKEILEELKKFDITISQSILSIC